MLLALLLSPQFVVAVNNPIMWTSPSDKAPPAAICVSAYIGLDRHQVLRLNYASYQVDNRQQVVDALLAPDAGPVRRRVPVIRTAARGRSAS